VLFDEFEKAHKEVYNILLQVLDEGFLTDSQGRKVDFRNTIIIMTSNLGADILTRLPEGAPSSAARGDVMEVVRHHLPPEFINRIDEMILFNRLSRDNMGAIVEVQLKDVISMLADKKIGIQFSEQAKELLAEKGYDEIYGARPLKRVIQREVLNPLSVMILQGKVKEGDMILVDEKKDELVFDITSLTKGQ